MPDVLPPAPSAGQLAASSGEELMELAAASARHMAAAAGRIALVLAELDRREGWRAEGATSLQAWVAERFGVSASTAKALARVAGRVEDLPHLAATLAAGEVSFDKVRAVADVATPESDRHLAAAASTRSLRELTELARVERPPVPRSAESDYERRSCRLNDALCTLSAQLPADTYAEVRGRLLDAAEALGSDGETPLDHRLCDALVGLIRHEGRPGTKALPTVVAHVALEALVDHDSPLLGELERQGLVDPDVVRRLACDATIVVAADDETGHTMYEGRARRFPTDTQRRELWRRDRHCRFPGCPHNSFVDPHHVRWWSRDGTTDLANLALLCEHHHHLVHSKGWTVSGDANAELRFTGPSGRIMLSRPSPLWTQVKGAPAKAHNRGRPPQRRTSR
jgi:Domain of unknown function (DUF222)